MIKAINKEYWEAFDHDGVTLSKTEFGFTTAELAVESNQVRQAAVMAAYTKGVRQAVWKWVKVQQEEAVTMLEKKLLH